MIDTTPGPASRARWSIQSLATPCAIVVLAALGLVIAAHLVFFAVHAAHLLSYPYPLDYGEGPLLAQVNALRSGTPIWQIYSDPTAPPYLVVNYPPVYLLAAHAVSLITGNALLAGRLVSLAATIGCVVALWLLVRPATTGHRPRAIENSATPNNRLLGVDLWFLLRLLLVLSFLALPIVREWAVVMRVDMLGVCFGLWGLVIARRSLGTSGVLWSAPLLLLSLFTKPSLLAAPAAVGLWLLFRDWRRALLLGLLLAAGGAGLFGLMQATSGGWFSVHMLTANANEWKPALARSFWSDQLAIHRTLIAAAALSAAVALVTNRRTSDFATKTHTLLLAITYACFGALTALGIGKVGAYLNYFLEFYAGLVWLAALGVPDSRLPATDHESRTVKQRIVQHQPWLVAAIVLLVIGGFLRYYPTWSQSYVKLAGIIEGTNPPRLTFGRHGSWQDLQRERDLLMTLGRVNTALVEEVRGAGGIILTDWPAVAAQAGALAPLQAFEHRQLYDVEASSQTSLLIDMANGQVPLVVLDYLGNWLTPEMIELIKHRYAQNGSRGTYDIYRPVATGPHYEAEGSLGAIQLRGYYLAPPTNSAEYSAGELLVPTLEFVRAGDTGQAPVPASTEVVMRMRDSTGDVVLEDAQPLVYGAIAPSEWPNGQIIQHMHPLRLPETIQPGSYTITVGIRGEETESAQQLATLTIGAAAGANLQDGWLNEGNTYHVPPVFLAEWERLGRESGIGLPIMPAVPFAEFVEQCFERACLRLRGDVVERVPLGELISLGDAGVQSLEGSQVSAAFRPFYEQHGGEAQLGPALTGEFLRNGLTVQYTRYARLERSASGSMTLGTLGEDFLRLPGGVPYRWGQGG